MNYFGASKKCNRVYKQKLTFLRILILTITLRDTMHSLFSSFPAFDALTSFTVLPSKFYLLSRANKQTNAWEQLLVWSNTMELFHNIDIIMAIKQHQHQKNTHNFWKKKHKKFLCFTHTEKKNSSFFAQWQKYAKQNQFTKCREIKFCGIFFLSGGNKLIILKVLFSCLKGR